MWNLCEINNCGSKPALQSRHRVICISDDGTLGDRGSSEFHQTYCLVQHANDNLRIRIRTSRLARRDFIVTICSRLVSFFFVAGLTLLGSGEGELFSVADPPASSLDTNNITSPVVGFILSRVAPAAVMNADEGRSGS